MKRLNYLFAIGLFVSTIPTTAVEAMEAKTISNEKVLINEDCPICLESLTTQKSIGLSCNHGYHKECLEGACKTTLIGNRNTPLVCACCREPLNNEILHALNLEITEDELFDYIISGLIDTISEETFNAIKRVTLSFLKNDEAPLELEYIASLSSDEAHATIAELISFLEPLTISSLKGQEYINELRDTTLFTTAEKITKHVLATNAPAIRSKIEQIIREQADRNNVQLLAGLAPYFNALYHLLYKLEQHQHILQNDPLFDRLQDFDSGTALLRFLSALHTGASKEDIRPWINSAEHSTDTWMLSKLFLLSEAWQMMPPLTQNYLRRNPGKKMATLWFISSVKLAIFMAACTLITDAIVRARLENYDKKRLEKSDTAQPITPYFSWPLRASALTWTFFALRAWRAHNIRPI